ncbi:DUF4625 domain-containing protein [Saccharicrinis aurantiacus]|uniref:DUF4625 domain-containing protein n=1 Tax=Saccharicrinis aurantiacus TaxID=1849719 RepID=UPI00094F6DDB|nr:DUF4625 domain-containing protein [Saccharicrinis aurantiacus]
MKNFKSLGLFVAIAALTFTSCEKEDNTKQALHPVISEFSVGAEIGDGAEIPLGGQVSFTFNVEMETEDRIISYHVEMHSEAATEADEFKVIDETFEVAELRNTHIHDHFAVPTDAPLGAYHFHVKVTSKDGYESEVGQELKVIANPALPIISNFSIEDESGAPKKDFKKGDVIVVKFTAEATEGSTLDHFALEIHDEPKSGELEDEFKQVDGEFTTDTEGTTVKGETKVNVVHKVTINEVGEAGINHFHLHVYDNKNNGSAATDKLTINE